MEDRFAGILLGTAVGDALGLPAENLSPARIRRLWRVGDAPWRHHFLLGRGMISDDTEHTIFIAQSLLAYPGDAHAFQRRFAWRLRWWLATLPAGVGFATLRSIMKLWLGFPPRHSGVHSAGNGPAMRVALIGAFFHDDLEELERYTRLSTTLTHTDSRALIGARAISRLVALAINEKPDHPPRFSSIMETLRALDPADTEWASIINRLESSIAANAPVREFAMSLGQKKGVTGYIYNTVPMAIYAWFRHYGDFAKTLESVLDLGGDTDTAGAIAGALAGATVGASGIPTAWTDGVFDWPRSVRLLKKIAERLARQKENQTQTLGPVPYFWPAAPFRNLFFLAVVLLHVIRRLLPPYA